MKKMKYCIAAIFAVLLLTAGNKALAAPICPVPQDFTQPDGSIITVTAYGDEFFSWREDENGNIIVYDEDTDSYRFAEIRDGKLVPASETAGTNSQMRHSAKRLRREDIIPLWENAKRIDYTQPSNKNDIVLLSATGEQEQKKPLTHQKLLTLLIEFSDVKLKYDGEFWAKRMYSTDPKNISVVNYWKENANGLEVFEPSDTSGIVDGVTGKSSSGSYTNICYTVTRCPDGVVKVSLDTPHPYKIWKENTDNKSQDIVQIALSAIEPYYDFEGQDPHTVVIFAGYNMPDGEGVGQVLANASNAGAGTSGGSTISKYVLQGELGRNDTPAGIGITCHELGHSVFNLPDLYFNLPNGGWTSNGLLYYSLMSNGCWGSLFSFDGHSSKSNIWDDPYAEETYQVPTHLDPWCKIQCGFITPTAVNDWDGDINSIPEMGVNTRYNVLEIRSKTAPNQYFLVENRQLIGYDGGLEAWNPARNFKGDFEGGIIIYHVDESVDSNCNNNCRYHHFIQVEQSAFQEKGNLWEFLNVAGRNKFNEETTPNSNLHELIRIDNWECSQFQDCHPQTLKSGISIEVLGNNGPSIRVKVNVEEEYRVSMVEGAKFTDLFPDANFCRAVIDNMREKDGLVRTADCVLTLRDWATLASIDDLQLEGYGIRELTGVEYFPTLMVLNCRDNEISDLSPLYAADLIDLDCGNNQLTEINLSHWEKLVYLYCDNNRIAELDISNNTQLFDLICSNNLQATLDTSQNPELYFLECENNRLSSLDLTNNPELRRLWCYRNSMDPETPGNSIKGLETLPRLGSPLWENDPNKNYFAYFPQNVSEHEHNWERVWQKNDTHHWHNCADDNCPIVDNTKKDGYAAHTKVQRNDSTQHWEVCSVCGWGGGKANHTYDNNQDTTCNTCGYERTAAPPVPPSTPSPSEPDLPDTPPDCPKDESCFLGRFTDTNLNAWYHDGVHYCLENGLMKGYSENTFAPNDSLTRAMLAQILYSKEGNPIVSANCSFDDVASGKWYSNAVTWAAEREIVVGYGDGTFDPDGAITREQLAVMLWRYTGSPAASGTLNGFSDQGKVSGYAVNALRWAVETGILSGKGNGILDPKGKATRAEAATLLYHYFSETI